MKTFSPSICQWIAGSITGCLLSLIPAQLSLSLPLSPGDRIKVSIPEGEDFSGIFAVNLDGNLEIPYLPPLPASGLEPAQVQQNLAQTLIQGGFFQPLFLRVSVKVVNWAPVQVNVAGAVFDPGRVLINDPSPEALAARQSTNQVTGDYPPERFLTAAIRIAGGITPTADIHAIRLIRNGQEQQVDLSGIFTGTPVEDIPLIAGDQVIVPESNRFRAELARPSQITIQGVRVYISNLTVPATSNSNSSINKDATGFVYGSRLSQAVISGNCAGGTRTTNANRHAVLVRTDRQTGKTTIVDRPIEEVLRQSSNDADNPLLMPNDGVACYDSRLINTKGVFEFINTIFTPFLLLRDILR
ncbi:polysaccharide biosynthesis/export family protein [Neosynechococcus sphagnicola]|uniref:polysaccharide biosynthesis/export family protein n=1 Tax=Neosynechococcus sphagnicola TaxID=1501145 RepID=UPI001EFA009F|nr:polysaccharide biosynthesis/export family protein [Neosynechococcus sphagnicola]